jgi:uncharacterized protein
MSHEIEQMMAEAGNKAEAYELSENIPVNTSTEATMGDVINQRYGRRSVLQGALAVSAIGAIAGPGALMSAGEAQAATPRVSFSEISHGADGTHHVAEGYNADILIRWGDPVTPGAPSFDPHNQTSWAQEQQFGYNNDYLGYLPLPMGSNSSDHGLLFVNHEYTNEELMFPGLGKQDRDAKFAGMTRELIDIEMSAHGGSIIEIKKKTDGKWGVVRGSEHARRITTRTTAMVLSGPAAGADAMKTSADPTGKQVTGMLNNCAGGTTPWGTVLTGEENIRGYFWTDGDKKAVDPDYARYGIPGMWYAWGAYHDRFNIDKEPNESNRFGYIVEVDPYDPNSVPIKRTALGRFAHEGANVIVNADGRVVAYTGDDARFEYLYKFVSAGSYDPKDRDANMRLLDDGTLYVARFNKDGSLDWLSLVHGEGKLTAANGFNSQADVCIRTRQAADLVGATPMDRPEDVEPNPKNGKVYVMLTNNSKRKPEQVDAANPRAKNSFGHIVEITPEGGNHASTISHWEILLKAGDPSIAEVGAMYHPDTSKNGWFAAPDNCAIDGQGRLWVSTDQGRGWGKTQTADGLYAVETEGELRGYSRMFFRTPVGAELCGPEFTPDDQSLFLAVQHPAADGAKDYKGFERNSTFEDPATRWPDFDPKMPVRPSVVVVTKKGGGSIGG